MCFGYHMMSVYQGLTFFVIKKICLITGADPRFLERGFICIKGWGFALLILSHFSYISHDIKQFGLIETKLFHFLGYLKMGGRKGVSSKSPPPPPPPPTPLDLPLDDTFCLNVFQDPHFIPYMFAAG